MGTVPFFLRRIRQLLEMIRFSHTLFALPFALLAGAMAWAANLRDIPPITLGAREAAGIVLSMIFARSAAMALNRLVDRHLDADNPRTQGRHLPTGTLSVACVATFTAVCSVGFVGSTLLFLPRNPIPIVAAVPVLAFLFGYSYAKRFTWLAHFWLGAALMAAPVGAWVALRPQFAWAPLVVGAAVLFWVAGFDIIYACQDVAFDIERRLHAIPARFGVVAALRIAALCHLAMVLLLAILPLVYAGFSTIYLLGIAAMACLLAYEHWLVRPDDLTRVNRAFFHVNTMVSVGLFLIGLVSLLMH